MNYKPIGPVFPCGKTIDGKAIICGTFQAFDTHGTPLWLAMSICETSGSTVSIPHFFASAMEKGWDDTRAFAEIQAGLDEVNRSKDMDMVKSRCIAMFTHYYRANKNKLPHEIGTIMREKLEENARN